jgi:hypothetical protein
MTHSNANGTNNKRDQYDKDFEKDYQKYNQSQVVAAARPDASDSKF